MISNPAQARCTRYKHYDKKTLENTEGEIKKIDNPEKLATYGTQHQEKQSKNTTPYVLDTTMSNKHK